MFVALFILLFVAQPVKGPQIEITSPRNQVQPHQKQNSANDTVNRSSNGNAVPAQNSKAASTKTNNQSDENEKFICVFVWDWIRGIKWSDWLLVLGTWLLAGTGIYQARRSHKNSRLELRAYVSITPDRKPLTIDKSVHALDVVITNNGRTPAYQVVYWKDNTLSYKIEKDIDFSIPEKFEHSTPMMLPVGGFASASFPEIPINFTESDDLGKGNATVYYWGDVRYLDAFGKKHFTRFRFLLNVPRGSIEVCKEGNEAT